MCVLCEHILANTFLIHESNSYHSVPLDIVGSGLCDDDCRVN